MNSEPRKARLGNVLWSALLVLGLAATVLQLRSRPASELEAQARAQQDARPQRLFTWEAEQATALYLRSGALERRYSRRAQGDWQELRAQPQRPALDPAAYLALLSQARVDRVLPDTPQDRTRFGLEPPQLHLDILGPQQNSLGQLTVGALTPDGYGRYVLSPQRAGVLIIPNYQFSQALLAMTKR